jgi:excisionase family DNA binding protein
MIGTNAVTKLLTPDEVANRYQVTTRTVRRWVRDGELPAILMPSNDYRIDPQELARWESERREIGRIVSANVHKRT